MDNRTSLKQRTAAGLAWGALNSGTTQVLNLLIGICLGRLLSPSDYGVVGVLTIFTAIAGDLQSSGFTQALVNLRRPSRRDYDAVFTFNTCVSLTIYVLLFLAAPLIAAFFRQPCLTAVSRLVFLAFVITSVSIAHGGYMQKQMMNREMAIIGAAALVTSGTVGITLAVLGLGYWALAWQQVAYVTVITLGRYRYVPLRLRPTRDMEPVRRMAPFALKILVTKIVNTLSSNILTVVFGRLFPIHQVGNYSQAFKWDTMAHSLVTGTVAQIAQPVIVEAGESDDGGRPLRVFRKLMRFTAFVAMPLMLGLAIVADEFIRLTIGGQWAECVPLLMVLCVSGAVMPLHAMYQNLAVGRGRSDVYMWLCLGQIAVQGAVIVAFRRYGMQTMVSAYSISMVLWTLPWHAAAGRLVAYRWRDMLRDTVPYAAAAAMVMTATYLATAALPTPLLRLAARVALAAALYYSLMRLAGSATLRECERFVIRHGRPQ